MSLQLLKKVKILEGRYFSKLKSRRQYKKTFGRELNLSNPIRYSEKLNLLKLLHYPNNPQVLLAGDKLGLHTFLSKKGLEGLASPILYSYKSADEIDWDILPNKFVIKKSNACNLNAVVTDKESTDKANLLRKLNSWMKYPYGFHSGELHYENMDSRIIVESFIEDLGEEWNIYCFNGQPKFISVQKQIKKYGKGLTYGKSDFFVIRTKLDGTIFSFSDDKKAERINKKLGEKIDLPARFDEMLKYAKIVSEEFPLVRVDFYEHGDRLVLSEMTFTPSNGFAKFPPEIDLQLGGELVLPDLS